MACSSTRTSGCRVLVQCMQCDGSVAICHRPESKCFKLACKAACSAVRYTIDRSSAGLPYCFYYLRVQILRFGDSDDFAGINFAISRSLPNFLDFAQPKVKAQLLKFTVNVQCQECCNVKMCSLRADLRATCHMVQSAPAIR